MTARLLPYQRDWLWPINPSHWKSKKSDWLDLEHVPPELNWQDSHGVLDRRSGIDLPLGGGRCRLPILLIFEVG